MKNKKVRKSIADTLRFLLLLEDETFYTFLFYFVWSMLIILCFSSFFFSFRLSATNMQFNYFSSFPPVQFIIRPHSFFPSPFQFPPSLYSTLSNSHLLISLPSHYIPLQQRIQHYSPSILLIIIEYSKEEQNHIGIEIHKQEKANDNDKIRKKINRW